MCKMWAVQVGHFLLEVAFNMYALYHFKDIIFKILQLAFKASFKAKLWALQGAHFLLEVVFRQFALYHFEDVIFMILQVAFMASLKGKTWVVQIVHFLLEVAFRQFALYAFRDIIFKISQVASEFSFKAVVVKSDRHVHFEDSTEARVQQRCERKRDVEHVQDRAVFEEFRARYSIFKDFFKISGPIFNFDVLRNLEEWEPDVEEPQLQPERLSRRERFQKFNERMRYFRLKKRHEAMLLDEELEAQVQTSLFEHLELAIQAKESPLRSIEDLWLEVFEDVNRAAVHRAFRKFLRDYAHLRKCPRLHIF